MTTQATAIRDAVFVRAQAAGSWALARKVDMPTLDGNDLPLLQVFLLGERLTPNGDANVGVPRFISDTTIGISVVRGFNDPAVTDGLIDGDVDLILDALLCDPTFVSQGRAGLFESVTAVNRTRRFPQQGETYFVETRLDLTFEFRVEFEPTFTTPLLQVGVQLGGVFAGPEADYSTPAGSEYMPGLND